MPAKKSSKRGRPAAKRSKSKSRGKRTARRTSSRTSRKLSRGSKRKRMSVSSIQLPMEGPHTMSDVRFNAYIKKLIRSNRPGMAIDSASTKAVDSILKETLHQIATQAALKMGRRKTLKPKLLLRAMKQVLPKSMALKLDARGQQALEQYSNAKKKRR